MLAIGQGWANQAVILKLHSKMFWDGLVNQAKTGYKSELR